MIISLFRKAPGIFGFLFILSVLLSCVKTVKKPFRYDNSNIKVLYSSVEFFHSPDEIMSVIERSEIQFNLNSQVTPIVNDITKAPKSSKKISPYFNVRQNYTQKRLFYDLPSSALKHHWAKARELVAEKDYEGAMNAFEEAIKIDPKYFKTYTRFGEVLIDIKEYNHAVKMLDQAVLLNSIDWEAYFFLSSAYTHKGEHKKARYNLMYAYMLNKNGDRVNKQIAYILKGSGYYIRKNRFEMAFNIVQTSEDLITINFEKDKGEVDMALATCFAAWDYTENYRNMMLDTKIDSLDLFKYKECLMTQGLAIATLREKDEYDTVPKYQRFLYAAILDELIDAIVLWEFAANKDPYSVLLADEQQHIDMVRYLEKYVLINRYLGI